MSLYFSDTLALALLYVFPKLGAQVTRLTDSILNKGWALQLLISDSRP